MVWMVWQDCCYAVLYYNISLALIACNNFCFETTKVDELSAQPQADGQICTTKFFFFFKGNSLVPILFWEIYFEVLPCWHSLPQGMHGRLECLGSDASVVGCGDMISSDHPNPEAINDCVCQHPPKFRLPRLGQLPFLGTFLLGCCPLWGCNDVTMWESKVSGSSGGNRFLCSWPNGVRSDVCSMVESFDFLVLAKNMQPQDGEHGLQTLETHRNRTDTTQYFD